MMGEIRTWTDKNEYLNVLKKEIEVLKSRYNPNQEGTGHFNTAISVLQSRIEEIENELNWPFPN
jgi:prefoldin subunit 5